MMKDMSKKKQLEKKKRTARQKIENAGCTPRVNRACGTVDRASALSPRAEGAEFKPWRVDEKSRAQSRRLVALV